MKFSDFAKRDDLCKKGQSRVLHAPGCGSIVKAGNKWYASRDSRLELIGVKANAELAQPTVGPFKSAQDAFSSFEAASKVGHAE